MYQNNQYEFIVHSAVQRYIFTHDHKIKTVTLHNSYKLFAYYFHTKQVHVIVIPWARVVCLIYTPKARAGKP